MVLYDFTGLAGNQFIRDRAAPSRRCARTAWAHVTRRAFTARWVFCCCCCCCRRRPVAAITHGRLRRARIRADVHLELERNPVDFLGIEFTILYLQSISTIPLAISALAKRDDVIVADSSIGLVIQKGLQISRSTIRWYDHIELWSLEDELVAVEKERKKRRALLHCHRGHFREGRRDGRPAQGRAPAPCYFV
jgi:hypothetical protein